MLCCTEPDDLKSLNPHMRVNIHIANYLVVNDYKSYVLV